MNSSTRKDDMVIINDSSVFYSNEILFSDYLIFNDRTSNTAQIHLELTPKSLIIRRIQQIHISTENNKQLRRTVTIERDAKTKSFGFSIKGGSDTGIPVLITSVTSSLSELLHVGDAILSINNEDVTRSTHENVIQRLRDRTIDRLILTVVYFTELVPYLYITRAKTRSSLPLNWNRLINHHHQQNRYSSIEYPLNVTEYSLLFARLTQLWPGTDRKRHNAFELFDSHGHSIGLFITKTSIQQQMWISRINLVIRNLNDRILTDLNQRYLSHEQIFYANWINERQTDQMKWICRFIVLKGNGIYLFDHPPSIDDFLHHSPRFSIFEIRPTKISLHSIRLTPNFILNFERSVDFDDFLLHYQRVIYLSAYSLRCQSFDCLYQGHPFRLLLDIHHGFELYQKKSNEIRWRFPFDQWISYSMDHDQRTISLHFRQMDFKIECEQGKQLTDLINAFVKVKSFELNSN